MVLLKRKTGDDTNVHLCRLGSVCFLINMAAYRLKTLHVPTTCVGDLTSVTTSVHHLKLIEEMG